MPDHMPGLAVAADSRYVRTKLSKTGLLALTSLLVGITPMFSQIRQGKKQENAPGDSIREQVRRYVSEGLEDEGGSRDLFALGDAAVPSLSKFLTDPDRAKRAAAARGLALIGDQQGVQALRNAVKAEKDKETKSAMSCFLAGGLVEAKSESDLQFLRSSADRKRLISDDDERAFTAVCAALALGMMERGDSLPVLREVARADVIGSEEVGKAIRWMENKARPVQPTPSVQLGDEELIKKTVLDETFFAEAEQDNTSVEQITFNRDMSKAFVSLAISLSIRSARGYDLVLAKENGVWRVVGIWFAWIA